MKRLLCVAAATTLLSACATPPPPPPPPLPPPPPPPPTLSQSGYDCAMRAAEADMFEIEAGRMAATMGQYPEVRAFGQRLVDDHSALSAQMNDAIAGAGIAPPPPPQISAAHAQQLDMLQNAGPNFDAVFLQSQISAHEEALALHRTCAGTAGPPTAVVHQQAVSAIQAHLDRARALSDWVRAQMGERG